MKSKRSAKKVMPSLSWYSKQIKGIDLLQEVEIINSDYSFLIFLDQSKEKIRWKRPGSAKKKFIFYQDKAPVH